MSAGVKNVTFSLPTEIVDKFKEYAKSKYIPSLNAGVKEALEEFVKKIEKEKLKRDMTDAANDPQFMQDLEDSMNDFKFSDNETSERIWK
jgi:hypothetical protein